MAQDNRNSQPAALTDGFSSQSKCDVVIEDAAADTAHADEEVAFIEDCDKRGSTSTAENISFSVYNLRAPSSAVFDRCGSPSSQGSEAGGDLLKRRSSSPVCLILWRCDLPPPVCQSVACILLLRYVFKWMYRRSDEPELIIVAQPIDGAAPDATGAWRDSAHASSDLIIVLAHGCCRSNRLLKLHGRRSDACVADAGRRRQLSTCRETRATHRERARDSATVTRDCYCN